MRRGLKVIAMACAALGTTATSAQAIEPAVRSPSVLRAALTSSDASAEGERPQRRNQGETCRRWRIIASRLGETYAGHRLRETIVARACALVGAEAPDDELWQWPWRHGDVRGELPPRLHGSIGAWTIRCGRAGKRVRCAMLHDWPQAQRADGGDATLEPLRIVSHFVIDTIGGRESVLWRVLISGTDAGRDRIEVTTAGKRAAAKAFLACGKPGCQMEADSRLSAEAANQLWDGAPLVLTLIRDGQRQASWRMSGHGFREALSELARLRREESPAFTTRR